MRSLRHPIARVSAVLLVLLSCTALLTVVSGVLYAPRPLPADEGTGAHIFQLSVAALLPVTLVFLASADWRPPWRSALPLSVSAAVTLLAFVGLYYLEHLR